MTMAIYKQGGRSRFGGVLFSFCVVLVALLPAVSGFVPLSLPSHFPVTNPVRAPPQLIYGRGCLTASSTTTLFGIPKMFRWLTDQYPDILNRQVEEGLSPDLKVDNFYLDMNGIIHPCTHGNAEGEIIVLDETAMFKKIFLYVDKLYKMMQPTKVLYLAVDGVAPRAKMNQQRSRRFRSAKEAEITAGEIIARGGGKELESRQRFDSNCITPGTDFMLKLSLAMQKWVEYKMETDDFWKNGADVIVSGPDVPGEGEHKVMDFIRETREAEHSGIPTERPHWKADYTHVLYGLDADLIMLGLVTHEPEFMLLREKMSVVMAGRGRSKYRKKKDMLDYNKNDFEVLELNSLRQMLAIQFRQFADTGKLKVPFELDRIIDDFVFMCMLVGNDFLPHCPHLEIDGGALSLMMSNYVDLLPEWGGYLTKKERLHPERFEQFMYNLSIYEEEHFKRRGFEENEPGWKLTAEEEVEDDDFYGTYFSGKPTPIAAKKASRKGGESPPVEKRQMAPTGNRAFRRQYPDNNCRSYRDFYYESKLGWKPEDRSRTLFRRREHVREYLEGLHWNMNYYHNGCQSWNWFFPYLYAPLATDIVNLAEFYDNPDDEGFCSMEFEHGSPFPSLAQLLSVLPPQSSDLLPKALAELMLHPASPIFPYYPPDFTVDPNGKRQSWEAIVQIPFIEADLLLDTVQKIIDADSAGKDLLTNAERRRNAKGQSHVFVPPGGGKRDEVDVSRGTVPPRTKNNRKTAAIGKRTIVSSQKG
jgi:5'-3' exoribonuclease 1